MPIYQNIKNSFRQFPFYLFGITLFFVLHGFARFEGLVLIEELVGYFFLSSLLTILVLIILQFVFKSIRKAGLVTAMLLLFYLFFGDIKAGIQNVFEMELLGRYSFILLSFFFILLVLSFYLYRSKAGFRTIHQYLNLLFLILCLYDLVNIFTTGSKGKATSQKLTSLPYHSCASCPRPDIYLIVLDEYAGNETLKSYFGYDNRVFLDFLSDRHFYVAAKPKSNYSASAISIASLFNMNNVPWAASFESLTAEDNARAEKLMDSSLLLTILNDYNYDFYNYSIFQIDKKPSEFDPGLLPARLQLLTAQTLSSKIEKDLLGTINTFFGKRFDWAGNRYENKFRRGNQHLLDLTRKSLAIGSGKPKFVYTHLMMPHAPYVFDSSGNKIKNKFFLPLSAKEDADLYLQYLVYANGVIRELVDEIQMRSEKKAAIVVMSDHGYRKPDYDKYFRNNNLNAVFLPEGNYKNFYDSVSNYNQFRIILNTLFDSQLQILRDSTYF